MQVVKTDFVQGARSAEGVVVVIDVFRAFSTACYCFQAGAERIIPVAAVEDALLLGKTIDNVVLVGERGGKKLPGFDCGNSPAEILGRDLHGKTIIHTTHAGTQGLVSSARAELLLTGAFVNARATARYIQALSPRLVTLVRMGFEAKVASDEDNLCADYLQNLLAGRPSDDEEIQALLRKSPFSARFFDPEKPWNPPEDYFLCTEFNRFDFAIEAQRGTDGNPILKPVRK